MHSRQRFVVLSIIVMAMIVAVALGHGFEWLWVYFGWDDVPIVGRDFRLSTALGYGVGLASALYALTNSGVRDLATEVVDELAMVSWPSRGETGQATVVVIVAVIVASAFLGLLDAVWLWLTDMVLGIG